MAKTAAPDVYLTNLTKNRLTFKLPARPGVRPYVKLGSTIDRGVAKARQPTQKMTAAEFALLSETHAFKNAIDNRWVRIGQ